MLALEAPRASAEKPKKMGAKRKLAALAFALAICSAGFWVAVTLNAGPAPEMSSDEPPKFEMLKLGEIYVDLQPTNPDELSTQSLMRINISVVYDPAELSDHNAENDIFLNEIGLRRQISAEATLLKDSFVTFLRELSADELEGSAGMELLKSELLRRARLVVGHPGPSKVLISELIVQ